MGINWKDTLKTVAPVIASALGTPMAGVAVSVALDALGIDDGGEDALIAAVTSGKPEVLAALKQADQHFEIEMRKLDIDLERINAQDRDSARNLGIMKGIAVQAALTFILTAAFSYILFILFEGKTGLDARTENIAFYAMGTLNGLLIQSWNFWFGTSKGSKDKTEQLGLLMK